MLNLMFRANNFRKSIFRIDFILKNMIFWWFSPESRQIDLFGLFDRNFWSVHSSSYFLGLLDGSKAIVRIIQKLIKKKSDELYFLAKFARNWRKNICYVTSRTGHNNHASQKSIFLPSVRLLTCIYRHEKELAHSDNVLQSYNLLDIAKIRHASFKIKSRRDVCWGSR